MVIESCKFKVFDCLRGKTIDDLLEGDIPSLIIQENLPEV
jgi:hypothetical protein